MSDKLMVSDTAHRLQELIEYFGIKQIDIVSKTGIPKNSISMYFAGERVPRQKRLTLIADAYGVNETWLMGLDIPMLKNDTSVEVTGLKYGKLLAKFSKLSSANQKVVISLIDNLLDTQ